MDVSQLLRALGLDRAYQAYQQNIGEPFAAMVGGAGRGYLGLDKPEYGGLLAEESYRTGQALGNMPGIGAPAGAFSVGAKAAAQVPGLLADAVQMMKANPEAGLLAITGYHGSPHRFSKFDASKIGSGEGAQAYGHGLYFAENPKVAKDYAVNLANRDLANQGRLNAHANAQRLVAMAGDPKYAADDIRFVLEVNPEHEQAGLLKATLEMLESGAYAKPLKTEGSLYTVDIPDEKIAQMLDWDKPLSQQPKAVQEALKASGLQLEADQIPKIAADKIRALAAQPGLADWAKSDLLKDAATVEKSPSLKHVAGVLKGMQFGYGITPDHGPFAPVAQDFLDFVKATQLVPNIETGGGFLGMLQATRGGPEGAAEALRQAGIPGVRYLDQGSRGLVKGTSNFVVFPGEEEAVRILNVE
jgi:hypothetical protein